MSVLSKYESAADIREWEELPDLAFGLPQNALLHASRHAQAAVFYSHIKTIKSEDDYRKYGPAFERSARRWGMMSFDTESLFSAAQNNPNPVTSVVLFVVATPDGMIMVFDLRFLSAVPLAQRTKQDVHDALPPDFRRLLVTPRVLKCGSGLVDVILGLPGIPRPRPDSLAATQAAFTPFRPLDI